MKYTIKVNNLNQRGGSSLVTDDDAQLAEAIKRSLKFQKPKAEFTNNSYEKYGFKKVNINPDGDCFFHSIAYLLGRGGKTMGNGIRALLCNWYDNNGKYYLQQRQNIGSLLLTKIELDENGWEKEKTYQITAEEYKKEMCKVGVFAEDVDIIAVNEMLKTGIIRKTNGQNTEIIIYNLILNGFTLPDDHNKLNQNQINRKITEGAMFLLYNGIHYDALELEEKKLPARQNTVKVPNLFSSDLEKAIAASIKSKQEEDSKPPPPRPPRPSSLSSSKKKQEEQEAADRKMAQKLAKELEQRRQQEAADFEYAKRLANQ